MRARGRRAVGASAVAALALLVGGLGGCDRAPAPEAGPLPRIGRVPDAFLVDHDGDPFRPTDMAGRVWVASFVFTSCQTVCPNLTSQMRSLGQRHEALRLVSFSVDPETDTPRMLRQYAARFDADLDRWTFVTGKPDRVRRAIVEGFKLHYGDPEPLADSDDPGAYDITHSTYFVLVDRGGWIRGYYRNDTESLTRLDGDVERLLGDPDA